MHDSAPFSDPLAEASDPYRELGAEVHANSTTKQIHREVMELLSMDVKVSSQLEYIPQRLLADLQMYDADTIASLREIAASLPEESESEKQLYRNLPFSWDV